ncbi:MAG: hypothetical protein QXT67_06815 [Candidatus Bathyarchaeia archaeon]
MRRVGTLILLMLIALFIFPASIGCIGKTRINEAVKYLLRHYDDEIGLICESKESAEHFRMFSGFILIIILHI